MIILVRGYKGQVCRKIEVDGGKKLNEVNVYVISEQDALEDRSKDQSKDYMVACNHWNGS